MADFGPRQTVRPAIEMDAPDDALVLYENVTAIGGQVSYFDARRLLPHQVAEANNLMSTRDGRRRRMPGSQIIVAPSDSSDYQSANGLAYFDDVVSGTSYARMVAHWKTYFHLYDGSSWSAAIGSFLDQHTQMVQGSWFDDPDYRATLFIACCTGTRQDLQMLQHTSSAGTWQRATNSDVEPRCVLWWQNRLWCGWEESISYTDVAKETFTSFANQTIAVDTDVGDEIMALVPARGIEPYLLIFMKRRIYVYRIVWASTALDFTTSYSKIITDETGCLATRTAKTLGPFVLFLAEDGVRGIVRAEDDTMAGTREPLSRPIHDVIETINWEYADTSTAMVFANKYYISVPTSGATVPNTILVWDLPTRSWNVWDGSSTTGALGMARGDLSDTPRAYYLMAQARNESSKNVCHVYYFDDDHEYEGSATELTATEITPAITFDVPSNDKNWRFIEIEYVNDSSNTATLDVDVRIDESGTDAGWTDLTSITMASGAPTLPATLPFDLDAASRQKTKTALDHLARGREIQFRFQETGTGEANILGYTVAASICPIERQEAS